MNFLKTDFWQGRILHPKCRKICNWYEIANLYIICANLQIYKAVLRFILPDSSLWWYNGNYK